MLSGFSKYLFGEDKKQQNDPNRERTPSSTGSQLKVDDWLLVDSAGNAVSVQEEVLTRSETSATIVDVSVDSAPNSAVSHAVTSADQGIEYSDNESSALSLAEALAESSSESLAESSHSDCLQDGPRVTIQDWESHSDTGLSDVSSQPEIIVHPSVNDCWFITPPPCFTGSQTSVRDECNPLENLLIEHPSMSVYAPRRNHAVSGYITPIYDIEGSVYDDNTIVLDRNKGESNSLTQERIQGVRLAAGIPSERQQPEQIRLQNITSSVAIRSQARNQSIFRRNATTGAIDCGNIFRVVTSRNALADEWKGKKSSEFRSLSRNAFTHRNRVNERSAKSKLVSGKLHIMQPAGKKYN